MTRHGFGSMSKEVGWLTQNELASQEHAYASGETLETPAHCLFGTEINFTIHLNKRTPEQQEALEASRASIVTELSLLIPKNDEQAQRKADWLHQVPELTPEELINYQIYRRLSVPTLGAPTAEMYLQADDSPETTLEFVFGNGLYQAGYYDNPGMFEMRTQAAKPTIAVERACRAATVANEVASAFGATFSYQGDHTNFSVWTVGEQGQGLKPVHALDNPEGQEVARKAAAGMLHALRDGMVALHTPTTHSLPDQKPVSFEAGPKRGVTLRVVPDRFEQRRSVGPEQRALAALILMAGFARGVTDPAVDTGFVRKEPQALFVPGLEYSKTRDLHMLRAIQRSSLVEGRFVYEDASSRMSPTRTERALSSIIGAEVYERGNGADVIGKLLNCISLGPQGELEVDEEAFNRVVDRASNYHISLVNTPNETISERLRHIRCLQDSATITGGLKREWPSGVTLHQDLESFVNAPSLSRIDPTVLDAIRQERAAAFTHEEAVAEYYRQTVMFKDMPTEEGIASINDLPARFPDADATVAMQLIRNDLQRGVARLNDAITGLLASATRLDRADQYRLQDWQKRCVSFLAILQGVAG